MVLGDVAWAPFLRPDGVNDGNYFADQGFECASEPIGAGGWEADKREPAEGALVYLITLDRLFSDGASSGLHSL
jgi:hypothetical protein